MWGRKVSTAERLSNLATMVAWNATTYNLYRMGVDTSDISFGSTGGELGKIKDKKNQNVVDTDVVENALDIAFAVGGVSSNELLSVIKSNLTVSLIEASVYDGIGGFVDTGLKLTTPNLALWHEIISMYRGEKQSSLARHYRQVIGERVKRGDVIEDPLDVILNGFLKLDKAKKSRQNKRINDIMKKYKFNKKGSKKYGSNW